MRLSEPQEVAQQRPGRDLMEQREGAKSFPLREPQTCPIGHARFPEWELQRYNSGFQQDTYEAVACEHHYAAITYQKSSQMCSECGNKMSWFMAFPPSLSPLSLPFRK